MIKFYLLKYLVINTVFVDSTQYSVLSTSSHSTNLTNLLALSTFSSVFIAVAIMRSHM